jgi:hypothetical protein
MKLTVSKSYVDAEGRVMAVTMPMPERPIHNLPAFPDSSDYDIADEKEDIYDKALKQVKDTSVRFEGHNNIKAIVDLIIKNGYSSNLKSDTFYDHDTVEVEIVEKECDSVVCSINGRCSYKEIGHTISHNTATNCLSKKVARILPIVEKPDIECTGPWDCQCESGSSDYRTFTEQSEWISVKDRLPEDDSDVFVLVNGKFPVRMDHYCLAENDWPRAWYKTSNVTHWLPMTALPSPPKP